MLCHVRSGSRPAFSACSHKWWPFTFAAGKVATQSRSLRSSSFVYGNLGR